MPGYVYAVDFVALIIASVGFNMAFRQQFVRRLLGRSAGPSALRKDDNDDPLTYVLRISGTMIMVFAIVGAGMMTLFQCT